MSELENKVDYDADIKTACEGKSTFVRYALIASILENYTALGEYSLIVDKFKGILLDEDINFLNNYIPAVKRLADHVEDLSPDQVERMEALQNELNNYKSLLE